MQNKSSTVIFGGGFIALCALLAIGAIIVKWSRPAPAPAPAPLAIAAAAPVVTPAQAAADARAQAAFEYASAVKGAMNDPKSFELVRAFASEDGSVCLRYRGKNKFNALVVEDVGFNAAGKVTSYKRACPDTAKLHDVSAISLML